jgi:hypothetical protein
VVTVAFGAAGVVYAAQQSTATGPANARIVFGTLGAPIQPQAGKPNHPAVFPWWRSKLGLASTTEFFRNVIYNFRLDGITPAAIRAETTTSPATDRNGVWFHVTDPNPKRAVRLANDLADGFPIYLNTLQARADIAAAKKKINTDLTTTSTRSRYRARDIPNQREVISYLTAGMKRRYTVFGPAAPGHGVEDLLIRSAKPPTPDQQTSMLLAAVIAATAGLLLSSIAAITLPRPPRNGTPVSQPITTT